MKLSNDIYIHFAFQKKKLGKIVILKKHVETLRSIFKI